MKSFKPASSFFEKIEPTPEGWVVNYIEPAQKSGKWKMTVNRVGVAQYSTSARDKAGCEKLLQKRIKRCATLAPAPQPERQSLRQQSKRGAATQDLDPCSAIATARPPSEVKKPRDSLHIAGPGRGNRTKVKVIEAAAGIERFRSVLLRDIENVTEGCVKLEQLYENAAKVLRKNSAISGAETECAKQILTDLVSRGGDSISTIRRHKIAVVDIIKNLAPESPEMQFNIAKSVHDSLSKCAPSSQKFAGSTDDAKVARVNQIIVDGLNRFLAEIKERHIGRLPTEIRIAKESVLAAATAAVPDRQKSAVARALHTSRSQISAAEIRWEDYEAGAVDTPYEPLETSVGAMDEEWVDFIEEFWDSETRASEKMLDEIR